MKITVLNGSPKGENSITLTYVKFLKHRYPHHHYSVLNISAEIGKLEKDGDKFLETMGIIENSDAVLWIFGVWVLLVPAQMIRFLELIRERGMERCFQGKHAASLSSSIHYLDHFCEHYIRAESEDLGMMYHDHFSLDMRDLKDREKKRNIELFFRYFIDRIEKKRLRPAVTSPLSRQSFTYNPLSPSPSLQNRGREILILSDSTEGKGNLNAMVSRFASAFEDKVKVVHLSDLKMKGACTGCMQCGYDNKCLYKDGFEDFYNNRVRKADIVIFAVTRSGRFLSSLFKTFLDRAFFWNHTPSLKGKVIGYLVDGSLDQDLNTRQFLEATATARQHTLFGGIVTDSCGDSRTLDALIDDFAADCLQYSLDNYSKGFNFLMHGAHKIFRDYNLAGIRIIWQADHRYYKKNGLYDVPRKWGFRAAAMTLMTQIFRFPAFRKRFYGKLRYIAGSRMAKSAGL